MIDNGDYSISFQESYGKIDISIVVIWEAEESERRICYSHIWNRKNLRKED